MLKTLTVLAIAVSSASANKHKCPMETSHCETQCRKYRMEVPRPTIYNWCQIGCRAVLSGESAKSACRYADLPRPTTTHACEFGHRTATREHAYCKEYAAKTAEAEAKAKAEAEAKQKAEAAAQEPVVPQESAASDSQHNAQAEAAAAAQKAEEERVAAEAAAQKAKEAKEAAAKEALLKAEADAAGEAATKKAEKDAADQEM